MTTAVVHARVPPLASFGAPSSPLHYRPAPDVALIAITTVRPADGAESLAIMQFVTREYESPASWFRSLPWPRRFLALLRARAALLLAGAVRRALPAAPGGGLSLVPAGITSLAGRELHWLLQPRVAWTRAPTREAVAHEVARSFSALARSGEAVPYRWRRVAREDLPADRTYRDAWRDHPMYGIGTDMEAARGVHRDRLRRARAPLLTVLDVAYQRAHESQDPSAERDVAARKQALRDLTAEPGIERARTPEELQAVWPLDLGAIA